MQALFRMVQGHCHSGQILIDDVDIDTLGLNQLRSQLAIIPQDPVLFSGTIRSNLDPVGALSSLPDKGSSRLWDALSKVGLQPAIQRLPGGLDAPVAEFGENLSAGQRQLLCLSRVLLRNTRIVLLDEASSSLDHESDLSIQRAIREAFPSSTMLIIAHRLNTIIACDKVLVMDRGCVVEFDHPHVLLSTPGSVFGALVDETGADTSTALRAAAVNAFASRTLPPGSSRALPMSPPLAPPPRGRGASGVAAAGGGADGGSMRAMGGEGAGGFAVGSSSGGGDGGGAGRADGKGPSPGSDSVASGSAVNTEDNVAVVVAGDTGPPTPPPGHGHAPSSSSGFLSPSSTRPPAPALRI